MALLGIQLEPRELTELVSELNMEKHHVIGVRENWRTLTGNLFIISLSYKFVKTNVLF